MNPYKIMILNLGSTSYKFKLYRIAVDTSGQDSFAEELIAEGAFERIGTSGKCLIRTKQQDWEEERAFSDHLEAFLFSIQWLSENWILSSLVELDAIGFKSVHAGEVSGARIINEEILEIMKHYSAFAPAHNPLYIRLMKQLAVQYPKLLQIGCFETSFHTNIPEKRMIYGVPDSWRNGLGIRRYGFHGSSHSYIAWKMQQTNPDARKIISLHLGGSSSLCAIEKGKSIATSMGATPQSGVFQNNRVGDFDIFCLPVLMDYYKEDWKKILQVLSKESGFLGVSGVSNDLREVLEAAEKGNHKAQLTVDAFVDSLIGYIGMFTAYLKGVDAIVFTGGIGLGSSLIRKRVCEELAYMGLYLDEAANKKGTEGRISRKDSRISVYTWKTNEELMVARSCVRVLEDCKKKGKEQF